MSIIDRLFSIIAPHECMQCGHEGSLLCVNCSRRFIIAMPERCYRCNALSKNNKTCTGCRRHSTVTHVWVRTDYNIVAKQLIHKLKFEHARDAARTIAALMYADLPALPKRTIIAHVPAATSRVRQRGYDQSALIARELAHLTRLPHVHILARIGQQRQVGAKGTVRREQMKGAFRVVSPALATDAYILLVDDVLTTGSTLEAAANELRKAGAKGVAVATFAQATR